MYFSQYAFLTKCSWKTGTTHTFVSNSYVYGAPKRIICAGAFALIYNNSFYICIFEVKLHSDFSGYIFENWWLAKVSIVNKFPQYNIYEPYQNDCHLVRKTISLLRLLST